MRIEKNKTPSWWKRTGKIEKMVVATCLFVGGLIIKEIFFK